MTDQWMAKTMAADRVRAAEDRARLARWVAMRRLRPSKTLYGCLHWVASGRCNAAFCQTRMEHRWMDHVSCWLTEKGERLLVCEPYPLHTTELLDLAQTAERFGLEVEVHGDGPYGYGTIAIELTPRAQAAHRA